MHALRQRIRGIVEKLERPDRMAKSKFARGVDIRGRAHPLFDQPDGLDQERVQQPVDREADYILDPDRRLSNAGERSVTWSK